MPHLSVLIPAHNAGRYIGKAVKSTLRSLPADAEVVVFDDASTDGTAKAVERIRDPRVHLMQADGNLGAAGAMRTMIARTDSALIARLDADDLSVDNRFSDQEQEIAQGADVSFGNLLHFGRRYRGAKAGPSVRLSPEAVRVALLRGNPLGHSTMFGKREVFGDDCYPDSPFDDYATWLTMAARDVRIVLSEKAFASYRHHPTQMTGTAKYQDARGLHQEPLRLAYNRLSESVLGVTPSETHPIYGSWAEGTGADPAIVEGTRARIEQFSGEEREYLRRLYG